MVELTKSTVHISRRMFYGLISVAAIFLLLFIFSFLNKSDGDGSNNEYKTYTPYISLPVTSPVAKAVVPKPYTRDSVRADLEEYEARREALRRAADARRHRRYYYQPVPPKPKKNKGWFSIFF